MSLFTSRPASSDSPADIFELLNLLESQARDKLAALHLPTELEAWTNTPALDNLQSYSIEKRAVDVLLECRNVRSAIDQGDAALAAWNAAYLITGVENANLDTLEKPIRHGEKNLAKLQSARESRKRKISPDDVPALKKEIDAMRQANAALSITEIRRQVGAKHGVSEKAIRVATDKYTPTR